MNPRLFHFSHSVWLWGLLAIPLIFAVYIVFYRRAPMNRHLERFADKELLPHLIKNRQNVGATWKNAFLIWSLAWFFGMMAMAGPQWRYTDVEVFKPSKDLVILLDLSSSMNAADLKPSRLVRAREEISDLLDMNHGLTIGLVAYADIPHMVVPLTDDMRTIHNLLPSLDTSLITVDGNKLKPALEMASTMLSGEPGQDKSILVVSDGNFTENNITDLAAAAKGVAINTMGIGTLQGAPIPGPDGGWVKDSKGQILIDRLNVDKLQALSATSHGLYVQANYDNSDTRMLLNYMGGISDDTRVGGKTVRTWDEGFYIPTLIMALLLLPWFRKGRTFLGLLMLLAMPTHNAQAADIKDWFYNSAQQGQIDFAAGHYDEAAKKFSDPYQQGVVAYKAGQFAQAETFFKAAASQKKPNPAAEYNLGNAQIMANDPEDAIKSYQTALKQTPDDASAKHNLEIAQKLLQQKQQQQNQQQSQNSKSQEGQQGQQQTSAEQSEEQKNSIGNNQSYHDEKSPESSQKEAGQSDQKQTPGQQTEQQQGQSQSAQQQRENKLQQQNISNNESHSPSLQTSTQTQLPKEQQQDQKAVASPDQENRASLQQTLQKQISSTPQSEASDDSNGQPNDQATAVRPRTQRDIEVDQWLNHIESDPGSFLKNQFMIEEKKSAEE